MSFLKNTWRCILHTSVGFINGWIITKHTGYGCMFFAGFFIYELNEDWHLKDGAYLDIKGWLWGVAVYAVMRYSFGSLIGLLF